MANHAKVKTKMKMTPETITAILERLNNSLFKNLLIIEYSDCRNIKGAWGKHVWEITVKEGEKVYEGRTYHQFGERTCWLNNDHSFEIRHGGGGSWIWWVDLTITNEIALSFDGLRCDDSDGIKEKGVAHKYDDFNAYLLRANLNKLDFIKSEYVQMAIPDEFKWKD